MLKYVLDFVRLTIYIYTQNTNDKNHILNMIIVTIIFLNYKLRPQHYLNIKIRLLHLHNCINCNNVEGSIFIFHWFNFYNYRKFESLIVNTLKI